MKIAFYSDTFWPQVNGVVRSLVTLAETLRERGHEIEVHAPSAPGGESPDLRGIRVLRYASFTLPNYRQYRLVIPTFGRWRSLSGRPDIIHTHTPFGVGWEAVAAAKHLGRPLVGTHHTLAEKFRVYLPLLPVPIARSLVLRYTARYYRHCQLVLASSKAVADELKAGGLTQLVQWISNPLDTDRFIGSAPKEALKQRFGLSSPALLYHGRIAAENRVEVLLDAMAGIYRAAPQITLTIAGDGPNLQHLKQHAARLGLQNAVKFPGMLHGQELTQLIVASDIFVSPSDSENQSMALLEAMAAGLAIVATRGGGTPEQVVEGENAYLAEPGDREGLAAGVRELLNEPDRCRRFGERSRELAQRFDRHHVAEALEKVYAALI
ncbi:glycosyltransferase [Candidatus Parcubacteria bacterium]|nr:glycosyltransferase [Candidatus Parcubacteria bacterium]